MRLGILLLFFLGMCQCMSYKEIEQVALYIKTLQDAGYTTIFSLFNIDRSASRQEITRSQSKLIKECYISKIKGRPMPVGKNLSEMEAKSIIVNGYQILTQPKLRKAYDWILDEAHPQFMENYKSRTHKKTRVPIVMPSIGVLIFSVIFTLIVFDGMRVYISQKTEIKKAMKSKISKKEKKQLKKMSISMKDMYICRGYNACYNMIAKFGKKTESN
ncbi:hypothetical protein NEIG_00125 [Nematocida sp. ERTm5]|nr:hypothetical protein NEIRO02_0140 [Nematocida sp. AWRm79]KAI5182361.1 hypothetical protein NEIRO03_0045 [Nematocida sp. AWRm78]OAG30613.1 hypothetical protein NEIG_00125 [Nematocida sp. ERTm5]